MLKKVLIGFVVVIIVLGVGAHYLWSNLDSYVKSAIEKYGTAATQTEVRLDSVKLSIASAQGELSGLSIANPKGFTTPQAFYLGSIAVKLDTSSLAGSGPIVIREIAIDKPQVSYELTSTGDSNLQAILHNAQAYAGSASGKSNASPSSGKSGRKIVIDDLVIRNGQISFSQPMIKTGTLSAPLPLIHLTNIGKSTGGATAGQVAEQVINSITESAAKIASSDFANQLGSAVKGNVGAGIKDVSGMGGQLKGLIGQ